MSSKDQVVSTAIGKKLASIAVALGLAVALTPGMSVVSAESEDHVVIISEAQTLEQVVKQELNTARFAKQIATYNGLDGINSVLPVGTTLQIPKPYLLDRDFGRIAFVKGDVVHVQKSLVVNPPIKGSMVYAGDVLTTGEDGFVSLSFNSGASVNLQPDSRVSVVDVDCFDPSSKCVISLNAERGVVKSEITPRPEGQPDVQFGIETPFLSAAVRGTAFYLDVDDAAGRIGVTRGLVATMAGASSNDLPFGKGLYAAPGVEPTISDLLLAPDLSLSGAESLFISEEDRISWKPLSGVENYQVTIANDEALAQPINVQLVENPSSQPMVDVPGQYFVSVAGIDEQQFVGMPTTAGFNYVAIDDTDQLDLQVQRLGNIVEVSVPGYSETVELIISNSIDSTVVNRRIVGDLSQALSLFLDPQEDWVFKARKILSDTSVSLYSNQYFLEATE